MNNKLEELVNDPNIKAIMLSVSSKYARAIDNDQMESIRLNTLWESLNKYDPERGAKFTSYLYQQLNFAFKNELKKKKREINVEDIDQTQDGSCVYQNYCNIEIFDGLPRDIAKILGQKYIYNMTMDEIGKENGYSRETARRRLHRAIKIYKNKNEIGT